MFDYEMMLRLSRVGLIYHTPEFLHHRKIKDKSAEMLEKIRKHQTEIRQVAIRGSSNSG